MSDAYLDMAPEVSALFQLLLVLFHHVLSLVQFLGRVTVPAYI